MSPGDESPLRRVRVLINPHSGLSRSFGELQEVFERYWGNPEIDLSYQFSRSAEDGQGKARRAIDDGVDTILVAGGDGMVNSIGSVLVDTSVALGVIPTGSGNGFARHFNIPLIPQKAVQALAYSKRQRIDVGLANGQPFFVTCSMAWDAAIVRTFEKSPIRGMLPYVLAGAVELIAYEPQPFDVILDNTEHLHCDDPLVFTVANLTEFGGGARIAPNACPDDGFLELVVFARKDVPWLLSDLPKLFDGRVDQLDRVVSRRFSSLRVSRRTAAAIQVDGELVEAQADVAIEVKPRALTVLVPVQSDV
jgi:diacylglycerol kinase (ATP)